MQLHFKTLLYYFRQLKALEVRRLPLQKVGNHVTFLICDFVCLAVSKIISTHWMDLSETQKLNKQDVSFITKD